MSGGGVERRRATRSRSDLVIELYEPEGRLVVGVGRLRDLSSLGFRFEGTLRLQVGEMYRARVRLQKNLLLEVPIKVAWVRGKGLEHAYGMEFSGISKADFEKMERWVKKGKV
ncbi:MAG: hypothetical protein A2992_10520 [Elusimicrobia bacterium RIFCSPLOWO2_01_FULL_59_12]|nr:MAG: hypothetical protein A2992_10520 [Elusimicrobia bacterium RIFCSPLOWO2_01_FULL_59_12]